MQIVAADLGNALVCPLFFRGVVAGLADARQHVDEVLRVVLGLVDAGERARGDEDGGGIGGARRQDAGERGARALGVAAAEEQLAHLRGDARPNGGVLRDGGDARERARHLERSLEVRAELDVAAAEIVVCGIDAERLLERVEGALRILQLVLLQDADAAEHVASSRTARVLQLDAEVARALLGGGRAGGERCGGTRREALALKQPRRDAARIGMRRIDLEERLHVGHRALRLLELVREYLDELAADAPGVLGLGGRIGDERLLEHPRDVAIAIGLHVPSLERVAQRLVGRIDLDEVLVRLDRLVLEVGALVEDGRALEEHRLLRLGAVLGGVDAEVGELLVVVDARELRVDALEGAGMRGPRGERLLEVGGGAELVAEDLTEERGGPEIQLRLHRRQKRLQLPALRDRLVREGQLRDAIVADGGVVELLPDVVVELVLREGDEERVDDLLLVLELRLERGDTSGARRRRRLHER